MTEIIKRKDSYLMYKNWSKGICKLTDEQAGQLLKTICIFQDGEAVEEPEDVEVAALFEIFKIKMIEDAEAYQAKCERLANNLKGNDSDQKESVKSQKGRKGPQKENSKPQKGNENTQMEERASVSLSLSDTDTDTDSKEKKESYGELKNVKLTVKEREKLINDYGKELTEAAIEYLDGYIADKNYKSKSNYQAIKRWVIDVVKDKTRASPDKFDADAYLRERAGLT